MIFKMVCPKCKSTKSVTASSADRNKLDVYCDDCGAKMRRDWTPSISVSEYDKASNISDMGWIKDRLKNRPSGKNQVFF